MGGAAGGFYMASTFSFSDKENSSNETRHWRSKKVFLADKQCLRKFH